MRSGFLVRNGKLVVFLCVKELVLFVIEVGFGKLKWYDEEDVVVYGFLKWWKSAEYLRRFGTASEETEVERVSMGITNLVRKGNEER